MANLTTNIPAPSAHLVHLVVIHMTTMKSLPVLSQTSNRNRCLCLALQAGLGKYCVHLLADYITVAAAPLLPPATSSGVSADSHNGWQFMEALSGLPGAALRQGALALYGACSPAEVTAAAAAAAAVRSEMFVASLILPSISGDSITIFVIRTTT